VVKSLDSEIMAIASFADFYSKVTGLNPGLVLQLKLFNMSEIFALK